MSTVGTRGRSGPRKVVQWRTSSPLRAARERERVPERVAEDARRAARPAEREQLELELRSAAERAEQPAHVPRGAGARLHERRGVDADPHASASSLRATTRSASTRLRVLEQLLGLQLRAPAVLDVLLVQHRLPVRLDLDRVRVERDPLLSPSAALGSRARAGSGRTDRAPSSPVSSPSSRSAAASGASPSSIPPATRCQ